jgi:tetratricopeptide (TPR) repeat protein
VNRLFAAIGVGSRRVRHLIARSLILVGLTWLPLAVLALAGGSGAGAAGENFFKDIAAYMQLVLGLPLFVIAERAVSANTRDAAIRFVSTGIIRDHQAARLDQFHRTLCGRPGTHRQNPGNSVQGNPTLGGPMISARRGLGIGLVLSLWAVTASAAPEPPPTGIYVEGLDLLSAGRWAEASRRFGGAAHRMPNDPRPLLARGVALALNGQFAEAASAFTQAKNAGYRGREPELWKYIVGRMANRPFDAGHGASGPRSAGGAAVFTGVPGHMLQGDSDYPTDYASFLYYHMATRYGEARSLDAPDIRQVLLDGARWFANRARTAPDLGRAMYERAVARQSAHDFAGALEQLSFVRVSYPVDPGAATLASDCWIGLGRHATARREATLALTQDARRADALLRRAAAGARLNRPERARADLESAQRYDAAQAKPFREGIEKLIGALPGPTDPREALSALERRAGEGGSEAALLETAIGVHRATLRTRRYYDELYADRVREFADQIGARPKDPEPLAAFAAFLIDESRADRRGEPREPRSPIVPWRWQADERRELQRALDVVARALALDRENVAASMQRARALSRLGNDAEAERIVDAVLARAPRHPLALRMRGQYWIDRGNGLLMAAALLRTPRASTNSWTESRSDGLWRVTQTTYFEPTQSDLNRAASLEQQGRQLLQRAAAAIDAALAATRGTLAGDIMLAEVRLGRRDLPGAEEAARAAIRRDPANLQARDVLVDVFRQGLRRDEADAARSEGANLVHTTAGWKLMIAWRLIEARAFDAAQRVLDEARRLDPADARGPALAGTLAHLQGKTSQARVAWRVALALTSARIAIDDTLPQPPPVPREPLEFGLAMALRERLAVGGPPAEALRLARENAAVARWLPPGGRGVQMFTAMLPDPDVPRIPARVPDTMAELLARAHVAAAQALLASTQTAEAMNEYRAAAALAAPPPSRSIPMIGDKRGRVQNSNFATYARGPEVGDALIALGRDAINRRDLAAAQDYLAQAVAARISRERRAEVNQLQFEIARRSR